jgi:hypothetical protein
MNEPFRLAMRRRMFKYAVVPMELDTAFNEFMADRDERFKPGNDKVWGEGNWIRCEGCPDSLGYPSYHHKDAHN